MSEGLSVSAGILLSNAVFDHIAPFHLLWDRDGTLLRVAPAIRRLWRLSEHGTPEILLVRPPRPQLVQ